MNRPIGFDLADLTATEARALRNTAHRVATYPRPVELRSIRLEAKRRRAAAVRSALTVAARVAGSVALVIGIVAWFAVWLGA